MSEIEEIKDRMKQLKADYQARGKKVLNTLFAKTFEAHPEIVSIYWRQYTPYFNDGDSCVFGVNDISIVQAKHAGNDKDDYEYGDYIYQLDEKSSIYKDTKTLESFLMDNEDIAEKVFGDHVKITATPDGQFDIEEYEHD